MTTTTKELTLADFLAGHSLLRVWYAGFGVPTGRTYELNTDTDCDEDYCDSESLANVLESCGAHDAAAELIGAVTTDDDGETRWEWVRGGEPRDDRGNSLTKLVVWA